MTTTFPEEEEEAFLELPCSPSQVSVPRTGSHARSRSPHWPDAWDWHTQCRLIMIPPANQEQRQGLPCLLHGGRNTLEHNQDSIGWEGGGSGCGVSLQLGWPCQGESLCHHITSGCQNELLPMSLTPWVSTFRIISSSAYSMPFLGSLFLRFYVLLGIVNFESMNQALPTSPVIQLQVPTHPHYLPD